MALYVVTLLVALVFISLFQRVLAITVKYVKERGYVKISPDDYEALFRVYMARLLKQIDSFELPLDEFLAYNIEVIRDGYLKDMGVNRQDFNRYGVIITDILKPVLTKLYNKKNGIKDSEK